MATAEQLARLKAVVPAAQASARVWTVPASVTLAQWITESSWGTSKLALACNNFFGIKGSHLAAPSTYEEFPTVEYESGKRVIVEALFAKFTTETGCFDAHASLLMNAPRYKPAMLAADHPNVFAVDLQKCGYSTSPTYGADLMTLMRDYNLYQYDVPVAAPAAAAKETP
jgi:flagellum-specific peptidoglycan hydrolase FlgJ